METVLYACGCEMGTVGQSFERGVLVCPLHGVSTAPYRHPRLFQGRVRLELLVEAESRERVQRWLDELTETLLREEIVKGLDTSTPA